MRGVVTAIATAVMFLTRLPVGRWASGDPMVLAQSTSFFPLVGLLVGCMGSLVLWVAGSVWPPMISVLLVLAVLILATGGFHEDGLADLADSCGAWSIERRLEIMRDSRLGTYGVLALVVMMLLKFSALLVIVSASQTHAMVALVLAHVAGRWSSLPLIWSTAYARPDSDNKVIAEAVDNQRLAIGTLIFLIIVLASFVIIGPRVLYTLPVIGGIIVSSRWWYSKKLGGVTGDALGASNVLIETAVYLVFAAAS